MANLYVKSKAYEITVYYIDDLPTETYYKRTRAEAETFKAEMLAEDDEIEDIEISEEPVEVELLDRELLHKLKTDSVPELNTDAFSEIDLDKLNVGTLDDIPAADPENMTI